MDSTICILCPDCETVCPVRFALLCSNGCVVYLTSCPKCKDGRSIRVYKSLPTATFVAAERDGLPVVRYLKAS